MSSPFKMDPLERIMMVRAACRVGSRVAPELTPCATPRCQGVTSFDITGQGTCLGSVPSAASAPSTPVTTKMSNKQQKEAALAGAKTASQRPDKKQQMKHALKVQSAHMITTDYVALSQPLVDGILLMDRTDRKLKLIKSLGELQPRHTYTTEYGNTLERTTKYKAVLAGSIELDVSTDEADFDAELQKLALAGASSTGALPTTQMRMAAYDAMANGAPASSAEDARGANGHSHGNGGSGHGGGSRCGGSNGSGYAPHQQNGQPSSSNQHEEGAQEAFQEAEAMQRLEALSERMAEMTSWFEGVKAEAERERRMREQAGARLLLMAERCDRAYKAIDELKTENKELRLRLEELSVAQEEAKVLKGNGVKPALMATSLSTIRERAD